MMHATMPALFLALAGAALWPCAAGLALVALGLLAAKKDPSTGTLARLCIAIPLAIFGAEHLSSQQALLALVPSYMPLRMFWVYFVGFALIAAALSIATGRLVRWSGLLYGIMMFLFVAMLHLPGAVRSGARVPWMIVFREMSFGGAGWVLAGIAMARERDGEGRRLIAVGRVAIAMAAILFGVEHFLHPLGLPGVPLVREMPTWVPGRAFSDYVTGALLVMTGFCFLLARKTRAASTYMGAWIVLLVAVIYVPVLIGALADPKVGAQIEGINYFADTLLFGGTILSLACEPLGHGRYRTASGAGQ